MKHAIFTTGIILGLTIGFFAGRPAFLSQPYSVAVEKMTDAIVSECKADAYCMDATEVEK